MNRRGFLGRLLGAAVLSGASLYRLVPPPKPKVTFQDEVRSGKWQHLNAPPLLEVRSKIVAKFRLAPDIEMQPGMSVCVDHGGAVRQAYGGGMFLGFVESVERHPDGSLAVVAIGYS